MITLFNRKELLITMDMRRQANVRDILSANNIPHRVKATNLQNAAVVGSSRARVGSLGADLEQAYEYRIYVHKKDHEKAQHLIR